jgi:hypothetical protein
VRIQNLPSTVEFTLRPQGTPTVEYDGSATIGQVRVRVHDDTGIAKSDRTTLTAKDLLVSVEDLPTGVTASLDPSGKNISLTASDAIGKVDVQLWTAQIGATSDDLPNSGDKQFVTDLGTSKDGVLVRDISNRYVVFARLTKLKAAKLVLDSTAPDVQLETGSRRDVDVSIVGKAASGGADEEIRATVANRPLCLRFRLARDRFTSLTCSDALGAIPLTNPDPNKKPTTILYEGSETTGRIDVNLKGFASLDGQELIARLDGVTPRLEAIIEGAGATPERIEVATRGGDGDVDFVEIRLRSGRVDPGDVFDSDPAKDAQLDGVLIRSALQRPANCPCPFDRKVVLARITALSHARVITAPSLRVEIDALAGREFRVVKEEDEEREVPVFPPPNTARIPFTEYLRATASALQRHTVLVFSDLTGATKIAYRADAEMPRLDLDTNITGSLFLTANARNVARSVDLCIHPGPPTGVAGDPAACNLNAFGTATPNGPTLTGAASAPDNPANPMTVDFLDCKAFDSQGQCGEDRDDAVFTEVTGLQLRLAQFQVHQVGDKTNVFLHTNRHPVQGELLVRLPFANKPDKIFLFARGVNAMVRRVQVGGAFLTGVPTQDSWSGDIDCTGGFDAFAVDNSFIGSLKGPLCDNPDDPNV